VLADATYDETGSSPLLNVEVTAVESYIDWPA
jgi:hypothetical protein